MSSQVLPQKDQAEMNPKTNRRLLSRLVVLNVGEGRTLFHPPLSRSHGPSLETLLVVGSCGCSSTLSGGAQGCFWTNVLDSAQDGPKNKDEHSQIPEVGSQAGEEDGGWSGAELSVTLGSQAMRVER